jgi:hypothetical protein
MCEVPHALAESRPAANGSQWPGPFAQKRTGRQVVSGLRSRRRELGRGAARWRRQDDESRHLVLDWRRRHHRDRLGRHGNGRARRHGVAAGGCPREAARCPVLGRRLLRSSCRRRSTAHVHLRHADACHVITHPRHSTREPAPQQDELEHEHKSSGGPEATWVAHHLQRINAREPPTVRSK